MPIDHLSYSSVDMFLECPMKWKRHYIEHVRAPTTAPQHLGLAYHEAQKLNFRQKILSEENLPLDALISAYYAAFDYPSQGPVDWGKYTPESLRCVGARLLAAYYSHPTAEFQPTKVEEYFDCTIISDDGAPIRFVSYVDVMGYTNLYEKHNGGKLVVVDHKTSTGPWTQQSADAGYQPTAYRMTTGVGDFRYHVVTKEAPPRVQDISTSRTAADVEAYQGIVCRVASEIRSGNFPQGRMSEWCRRRCRLGGPCVQ